MKKIAEWLTSWWITRSIRKHNPQLWRLLTEDRDPDDWVTRRRPGV